MNIDNMPLNDIWEEIEKRANENPELIKDMNASYAFDITGKEGGMYQLAFKDGNAYVQEGSSDADCTLSLNGKNFRKLLQGNLNATTAFMTGRLKVKGNIGLALKLEELLKKYSI